MLFAPKEKGQGLVEYALILVLVAIVVIGPHAAWPDHWRCVQHHQRKPLRRLIVRIQTSKKALSTDRAFCLLGLDFGVASIWILSLFLSFNPHRYPIRCDLDPAVMVSA